MKPKKYPFWRYYFVYKWESLADWYKAKFGWYCSGCAKHHSNRTMSRDKATYGAVFGYCSLHWGDK